MSSGWRSSGWSINPERTLTTHSPLGREVFRMAMNQHEILRVLIYYQLIIAVFARVLTISFWPFIS